MAGRHLLYFTAEDHYLYVAAGGKLRLEARFSGDDLGVSEFREYLRGRKGALIAILADLAGEYSVPLRAPALAARLGARGTRALIVTAMLAGLRQ
jgi:hypothetical protein